MDICTLTDHRTNMWNIATPFDADAMRTCLEDGKTQGTTAEGKVENVIKKVADARTIARRRIRDGILVGPNHTNQGY